MHIIWDYYFYTFVIALLIQYNLFPIFGKMVASMRDIFPLTTENTEVLGVFQSEGY
jgi:hypothetical protein